MAGSDSKTETKLPALLTREQDALLDQYLNRLDTYLEELKSSEKVQVEIETLHLKRMLSK